MTAYLLTNIGISLICLAAIAMLRRAPARLRLYVTLMSLVVWLMPWSLLSHSPLAQVMPQQALIIASLPLPDLGFEQSTAHAAVTLPTQGTVFSIADISQACWIASVFGIGLMLFAIDMYRYTRLQRIWRASSKVNNTLWDTANITNPPCDIRCLSGQGPGMATGIFTPTIWIDAAIKKPATIRMVILHELTHIRQKDPLLLWFLTLLARLLWWNPITWLTIPFARQQIELSCDEQCQKALPPDAYRHSLIETLLSRHHSLPSIETVAGVSFTRNFNVKRIHYLTEERVMKVRYSAIILATGLIAGWVGLSNAAPALAQVESTANADTIANAYVVLNSGDKPAIANMIARYEAELPNQNQALQAQTNVLLGQYYAMNESYDTALRYYQQALQFKSLLAPEQVRQVLKMAGDLSMQQEHYEQANQYWYELVALQPGHTATIHGSKIAVNHYLLQQYDDALNALTLATDEYASEGKVGKQNWLNLRLGIEYEQGHIDQALNTAKALMEYYPSEVNQMKLNGLTELVNNR